MTHKLIIGLILAFLGWRIYARLRRNVGRQPFQRKLLWLYVAAFVVASVVFGVITQGARPLMLGWISGVVLGGTLGLWGLRLTRFEAAGDGRFFTPNGHIGVALTLIFVGRLAYRVLMFSAHLPVSPGPPPGQSALTFLVFELLASYYIVYYSGVLRHFAADGPRP